MGAVGTRFILLHHLAQLLDRPAFWIWRTRSRVILKRLPTSSSVSTFTPLQAVAVLKDIALPLVELIKQARPSRPATGDR
jgi:hypothetical protein